MTFLWILGRSITKVLFSMNADLKRGLVFMDNLRFSTLSRCGRGHFLLSPSHMPEFFATQEFRMICFDSL